MANTSKEKYILQTENSSQFKWYQLVLPHALMWITGRKRQYVENIQWSPKAWTYNIFRVWEMLFWRRVGNSNTEGDTIRPEMGSIFEQIGDEIIIQHHFYTFEALVVHAEGLIRAFFTIPEFTFRFVRLPEMVTTNGFGIPQ